MCVYAGASQSVRETNFELHRWEEQQLRLRVEAQYVRVYCAVLQH